MIFLLGLLAGVIASAIGAWYALRDVLLVDRFWLENDDRWLWIGRYERGDREVPDDH